jgi:hypothetical protein
MASAQVAGLYSIYIESPTGERRQIRQAANAWWAPGGSPNGAIANTPEKWNTLYLSPVVGGSGYKIVVTLTAGAAVTLDASDGAWVIPIVVNGAPQTIGNAAHASGRGNDNFSTTLTPADTAYVAGVETPVAIYTANQGVSFQIGGDGVFMSIEDNTV